MVMWNLRMLSRHGCPSWVCFWSIKLLQMQKKISLLDALSFECVFEACTKVAVEVDKVYAKLLREGFLAVRH